MTEIHRDPTVIADRLRPATGFCATEQDWIVGRLAALGSRPRARDETTSAPGCRVSVDTIILATG